jgi:hypothetical protein
MHENLTVVFASWYFLFASHAYQSFLLFPFSFVLLLFEHIFPASVSQKALRPKNNNSNNLRYISEK